MAIPKPFFELEAGDVFKFIPTGEIMAKVGRNKVLLLSPNDQHEDEKGKIVKLVKLDVIEDCLLIDINKGFYK